MKLNNEPITFLDIGITMIIHLNINGENPLLKSSLIYIKEMYLLS